MEFCAIKGSARFVRYLLLGRVLQPIIFTDKDTLKFWVENKLIPRRMYLKKQKEGGLGRETGSIRQNLDLGSTCIMKKKIQVLNWSKRHFF